MKTKIKTGIAAVLLLSVISCTKENINSPKAPLTQSSENLKVEAKHTIGQSFHGGIIFYIDNTGNHGLIAATADQGDQVSWKNNVNTETGATGTAVGTGAANTATIVSVLGNSGSYAALLCSNYSAGKFKDWYLPSKDELNLLYQHMNVVPGLSATNYWSSSEVSKSKAWDQEFGGGFTEKDRKTFTLKVRPISSF